MRAALVSLAVLITLPAGAAERCPRAVIQIHKGKGELLLTCDGKVRHRALVTFGGNPVGPKLRSGDQRTPEGSYALCRKYRSKRYYKFLAINYPSPVDARGGVRRGLIGKNQQAAILAAHRRGRCPPFATRLGGAIGIHGFRGQQLGVKLWTRLSRFAKIYRYTGLSDGCIVATNDDMDRLWGLVRVGTPVHIR